MLDFRSHKPIHHNTSVERNTRRTEPTRCSGFFWWLFTSWAPLPAERSWTSKSSQLAIWILYLALLNGECFVLLPSHSSSRQKSQMSSFSPKQTKALPSSLHLQNTNILSKTIQNNQLLQGGEWHILIIPIEIQASRWVLDSDTVFAATFALSKLCSQSFFLSPALIYIPFP